MPCFKGIAVSIHANGAPLPEHGMQKQSRFSRISTYIPVPQPQVDLSSNKPDPAKFAISITLLTPGLPIPYSAPKPTDDNPYPKPQYVGGHSNAPSERNKGSWNVNPYIPMTNSENETIAAYIYFDGRSKEEVATLLRPGEETWVNSRWVQVPDVEGGGLAEREFLFREVGLERWLNGLDLKGHDAAEKLERRRQRFERRRRRQGATNEPIAAKSGDGGRGSRDAFRYGADAGSPVEAVLDDMSSDSLSDDDEPPEATGQIKVLMFRVLASGEIKKGEYSPQFDAHDDDDEAESATKGKSNGGGGMDADVEHTTSFAKPKTLDPKTISTQTVTGIDGPDKPYASFTFFYRGERKPASKDWSPRFLQGSPTYAGLSQKAVWSARLFNFGTSQVNWDSRLLNLSRSEDGRHKAAQSSEEDEVLGKMEDIEEKDLGSKMTPEDGQYSGELADGVNRIRLKRALSADPGSVATDNDTTNAGGDSAVQASIATQATSLTSEAAAILEPTLPSSVFGSPLKKQRPSIPGPGDQVPPLGLAASLLDGSVAQSTMPSQPSTKREEVEEDL
ncbi:uncharacterized protein VDAG_07469 [Verticillium dahliae VdLs.17]|uniref:DUF7918 domain-containing protein n=1 Tax=Verticillium dahliae (strain VdLs.17 / ATCC MYA-4575 / FGSC 10137) TaxID=498257 RepID=G2XB39_VERDV|nr:uncharacterized protein VDAG_07469 [Verticillium dahliae VdLs.17]EGY16305.1 hypothetical protein VDAG_07469 [Verticillium dahliae VdLs.17]KAH6702604.1 hypothetical protein EV126DRAFT_441514 [Verticillium dahliae]